MWEIPNSCILTTASKACPLSNLSPVFGPSIEKNTNKRRNHLATRETANYLLHGQASKVVVRIQEFGISHIKDDYPCFSKIRLMRAITPTLNKTITLLLYREMTSNTLSQTQWRQLHVFTTAQLIAFISS